MLPNVARASGPRCTVHEKQDSYCPLFIDRWLTSTVLVRFVAITASSNKQPKPNGMKIHTQMATRALFNRNSSYLSKNSFGKITPLFSTSSNSNRKCCLSVKMGLPFITRKTRTQLLVSTSTFPVYRPPNTQAQSILAMFHRATRYVLLTSSYLSYTEQCN